jgi:hypothetical protein
MTVNELAGVWLYRGAPTSQIKIWDLEEGDYIYPDIDKDNTEIEDIGKMKVECFYSYYNKQTKTDILIINVRVIK